MFTASSQKFITEVPPLGPQNMYVGSNGLIRNYAALPPATRKRPYMTVQTIVLTFSVLFCMFSCFLTVTLSNKWHTDTNVMIGQLEDTVGELARDIRNLTDLLKEEMESRRSNDQHKNEPKSDNDDKEYEDFEDVDYDENRFMDKDLSDNRRAVNIYQDNSRKTMNRQRRNAEIDTAIKVKNELNSPNNEKQNVEISEEETTTEDNTVKPYNRRKAKKGEALKKKLQIEDEEVEEKEGQEIAAAHFSSDSSKYNTRTHLHYNGNGRLRHPDGDFRDWTHYIWDTNLNNAKSIQMKNGRVEISKPGLYYVYAQIYYSDQHDINGYYIMKNDENTLGCTTTRHRETQSDSCYTAGLIYFNKNDILSIKGLDSERYILLDSVKTFFGLFKVA